METEPPSSNVMAMDPVQKSGTETDETLITPLRGGCGIPECLAYIS